jgi:hypothetical protein
MADTLTTVFDPAALAAVREAHLMDLEEELTTFARTASAPIERYVQAELAEEVRNLRIRWQVKGLINLSQEAQAVTAAAVA